MRMIRAITRRVGVAAVFGVTLLAAGCATYGPNGVAPGQTVDEVTARLGKPTGRYTLDDGRTRMEFARGPMGHHTFMVDLGADGRVSQVQQVLTESALANGVQPGLAADELLRRFGRPSERRSGGWQGGEVWSYRYDVTGSNCQWFQVSVIDHRVRDSAFGIDPMCDSGGNDKDS